MPTEIIAVLVRVLVTMVTTYLVTKGVLDEAKSADFIASATNWVLGGAAIFGTIAWSIYEKIQARRKLEATRNVAIQAVVDTGVPPPVAVVEVAQAIVEKEKEKQ